MAWSKKIAPALGLFFLSSICLGAELETIIDTGTPDFSGFYEISPVRFMAISFDLSQTREITSIEVYTRIHKGTVKFELTESIGPETKGVLRKRTVRKTVKSQIFERVLLGSITLRPGTYYVVISSDDSGQASLRSIPYRAPNVLAQVSMYEAKQTNGAWPPGSTWAPLDKNLFNAGFRVIGTPVKEEKGKTK